MARGMAGGKLPVWLRALFACVALLLAFAPAAEALACGGEATPRSATIVVGAADAIPRSGGPVDRCQPGHCHHGVQLVAPRLDTSAVFAFAAAPAAARDALPLADWRADRLDDPPRG